MTRPPCSLTQSRVVRFLKAAKLAGVDLACTRIEVAPDDTIGLVPCKPGEVVPPDDLDQELAAFEARHES